MPRGASSRNAASTTPIENGMPRGSRNAEVRGAAIPNTEPRHCLYTEATSSEESIGVPRLVVRQKDLVLVIGGATHTSSLAHALHLLYERLSESVLDDVGVVVVDPTPEKEWAERCTHRVQYRLKHEPLDLDSFLQQRAPSDLVAQYRRIAVIDDVFFKFSGYSDLRAEFTNSAGYLALTQTAERSPEQFTWWELEYRTYAEPVFLQFLFGADAPIRILSLLLRSQRSNKRLKSKIREVDVRSLHVEQLFSKPELT